MKKVIIFGTGKAAEALAAILKKDVKVIVFADNNKVKWGNVFLEKHIINPKNIVNYEYDYILIASQYERYIYEQLIQMKIDKSKIFKHIQYIDNQWDFIGKYSVSISKLQEKIKLIVTGISYAKYGYLSEEYNKLDRVAINMANGSQDLYFDYELFKYMFLKFDLTNLKKVIIGLAYYSFEYDLSLSSMKDKVWVYYKNLNIYHNNPEVKMLGPQMAINEKIAKDILILKDDGEPINRDEEVHYYVNDEAGKLQADIDCNKNYPETVKENKRIFKDYLELLIDNNIEPIVVVFPTSKYYSNHFSNRIENEFNDIITEFRIKYKFKYFDFFRSDEFDDEDFRDVSHLNNKGAKKFTKILNDLI